MKNWMAMTTLFSLAYTLHAEEEASISYDLDDQAQIASACCQCCNMDALSWQAVEVPCWEPFLNAGPIFFQARENGLSFALRGTNTSFINADEETPVENLDFDWSWGFRAAVGTRLPHDGWKITAGWQRLYTQASRSLNESFSDALFPVFLHPASFSGNNAPIALSSKAEWNLRYNQIDLELDRTLGMSRWFDIRPHAGLRSSWIYQNYDVTYSNLLDDIPQAFGRTVDMKCNFWGIGVLGGIDIDWKLGKGWSLATDFETALLYGYFKLREAQNYFTSDEVATGVYSAPNFYHTTRVITDFLIGVKYNYCFEEIRVSGKLGWEHHVLYGQNQFLFFVDETTPGIFFANQGDLTIQGISLIVQLDF